MSDLSKMEVKSCPFCATALKRIGNAGWTHPVDLFDTSHKICVMDGVFIDVEHLPIWNRRAPPPELASVIAEMEYTIDGDFKASRNDVVKWLLALRGANKIVEGEL